MQKYCYKIKVSKLYHMYTKGVQDDLTMIKGEISRHTLSQAVELALDVYSEKMEIWTHALGCQWYFIICQHILGIVIYEDEHRDNTLSTLKTHRSLVKILSKQILHADKSYSPCLMIMYLKEFASFLYKTNIPEFSHFN